MSQGTFTGSTFAPAESASPVAMRSRGSLKTPSPSKSIQASRRGVETPAVLVRKTETLMLVQAVSMAGRGALAGGETGGRFASWSAWEHLARAAAAAYGVYVALANRVGVEGPCVFAGGSLIVAPGGAVLARGDDLAADRPTADLSLETVAAARRPYSHARDDDPRLVLRELERLVADGA